MPDRRREPVLMVAAARIPVARVAALALGATMILAPLRAAPQETTSTLSGYFLDGDGRPVAGARLSIVHLPSGTSESTVTDARGAFTASGLRVGGPYRVSAEAEGLQAAVIEDLFARLAEHTSLTLVGLPIAQLADVEVTGTRERNTSIGAASRFRAQDVRELPSISRDIKDIARIDPKAWVDATNSDALEVGGVNPRYNTITVDGVRQSDDFGLNSNGYPTQRSPLSVDAVEAVSVLSAPFSVEYSFFRGSTINVVTRSGTNELAGTAFYYRGDDSLVGDETPGAEVDVAFAEDVYGATLGGPIAQDRLFFFLSYEKLERVAPQDIGATGSGFPVEVPNVSQADYDRIRRIGLEVYGFDIGVPLGSAPEEDEKILAKLDWNINGAHRAALAYQRTEGNELIVDATNNNASLSRLGSPSNWYDREILMETSSLQLFSDWTGSFSTELRLARKEVDTAQASLFGTEFGEMAVTTTEGGTVYLGSDEFRHANELGNDVDSIKLTGHLFVGGHNLMAGYEREMLDIVNLFVPRSQGQWVFPSIDHFEARTAASLSYANAFTNVAADAGASFGYDVDSIYVQDDWQATRELKLQAGLRLDLFSSSDKPQLNENFANRYGFNNQSTLDGRDLLMPRVGFNWQVGPRTTLYGGYGLFGGGMPNVWVANSFANDGVTLVRTDVNPGAIPDPVNPGLADALVNVDGYAIPRDVLDFHAAQRGDGPVNSIDPQFEIPSIWRWNVGLTHTLPWEIELSADLIHSRVKDEVLWQDLRLRRAGEAPDGRPIYEPRPDGRSNADIQDLMLTNTRGGESTILTFDASKTWRTGAGRFDAYLGYANQDVKDVNPGTSSTASSNWDNVAVSDPNNPGLETSNYEIRHRFSGTFGWTRTFFGDSPTTVSLVGERRSGRPYSYTFGAGSLAWGDPRQAARQRHLFYVPDGDVIFEGACSEAELGVVTGCDDIGDFSAGTAAAARFATDMEAYIDEQGLEKWRGRIMPRNSHRSPWITTVDLRFAQELPVFRRTRSVVTFDIENLTNLLNSDWGQLRQVSFPHFTPVADANRIAASGCPNAAPSCYVYRPRAGETGPVRPFNAISSLQSVWRMQLGFRIEF